LEFRLVYRGRLHARGDAAEKQRLRRHFHRELVTLWGQLPLSAHLERLKERKPDAVPPWIRLGEFWFVPLISERAGLVAELEVLFLRPQLPGAVVSSGGDLDNRIKTLLDALRTPQAGELASTDRPGDGEDPFYCLLENDILVTRLAVTADQLLQTVDPEEVFLIIHVEIKKTGRPRLYWSFP
jgi:hypothetical protein